MYLGYAPPLLHPATHPGHPKHVSLLLPCSEAEVSILVSGLFFLRVIFGIILKYPIPRFKELQ